MHTDNKENNFNTSSQGEKKDALPSIITPLPSTRRDHPSPPPTVSLASPTKFALMQRLTTVAPIKTYHTQITIETGTLGVSGWKKRPVLLHDLFPDRHHRSMKSSKSSCQSGAKAIPIQVNSNNSSQNKQLVLPVTSQQQQKRRSARTAGSTTASTLLVKDGFKVEGSHPLALGGVGNYSFVKLGGEPF